ncbi:cytochrome c3 family protein [uncultured Desulfuromonas sp.]|uniref:cytochrome c3 family protein n=1 Tax=uncultured Desulfuromonas sp. TaxID=181013 RepID=UPI002AAB39FE|nr:cytochrome c3 family protein [uncultured Desulfuromonas sp.]
MKKLIIALLLVAVSASFSLASDVVTYAEGCKKGPVTFDHKSHSEFVENSCKNAACHGDATPAKIVVDKKTAHGKMCKICHKTAGGPTRCGECHVK